ANVFNVPVSFLNDTEGQSYSSNEQLMIQFVQMTLTPIARQYEQEMNRKLLNKAERQAGYYFKFNMSGLLRGDTAARTQFYQMMLRSGGLTPDEVRELEDKPPKGGSASQLWISGDLYPIDMDPTQRKGVKSSGKEQTE
ncbi:portal protein, partial [Bacillus toyonensis]